MNSSTTFWRRLRRGGAALLALLGWLVLTQCQSPKPPHPETETVRQLVHHYFETWSKPDMVAYGECFDPQARIFFKSKEGQIHQLGLTDFVHGQKMSHLNAKDPMKEFPKEIRILMDDQGAQAHVTWILHKGKETTEGTDLFTYVKTAKGWKILSLVFYEDLPATRLP